MNTQNERNKVIIDEFRANSGKVGGRFTGKSLLLLHTRGRRPDNPASILSPTAPMAIDLW